MACASSAWPFSLHRNVSDSAASPNARSVASPGACLPRNRSSARILAASTAWRPPAAAPHSSAAARPNGIASSTCPARSSRNTISATGPACSSSHPARPSCSSCRSERNLASLVSSRLQSSSAAASMRSSSPPWPRRTDASRDSAVSNCSTVPVMRRHPPLGWASSSASASHRYARPVRRGSSLRAPKASATRSHRCTGRTSPPSALASTELPSSRPSQGVSTTRYVAAARGSLTASSTASTVPQPRTSAVTGPLPASTVTVAGPRHCGAARSSSRRWSPSAGPCFSRRAAACVRACFSALSTTVLLASGTLVLTACAVIPSRSAS